jgi:HK97 family phage portal protein
MILRVGLFSNKSYDILKEELETLKRAEPPLEGVKPPSRAAAASSITVDQAQSMSIILRGLQVHQTAAKQCTIYGVDVDTNKRIKFSDLPSAVKKPVLKYSFQEYTARSISSFVRHANCYRLKEYDSEGNIYSLIPMNAADVTVVVDKADPTRVIQYLYQGEKYFPNQISHTKINEIDELPVGLSMFDAANIELKGMYDTRNYTRRWLQQNSVPLEGYLKALNDIDEDEAKRLKAAWKKGTQGEESIAVLPNNVDFEPLYLKPSELQWIDVQKFDAIQQCRLLGLPASVMLIGLEGNSQTYANIEQDWIGYTRYGLMTMLLPLEEELTSLTNGRIRIKFNTDALLRSDTLTRYQAHAIALGGEAWMLPNEIRDIEDRDEIDPALLNGEAQTSNVSVDESLAKIIKAKADAIGVLVRAGASQEDAAKMVGLTGVDFPNVPTTVRIPATEATSLEGSATTPGGQNG